MDRIPLADLLKMIATIAAAIAEALPAGTREIVATPIVGSVAGLVDRPGVIVEDTRSRGDQRTDLTLSSDEVRARLQAEWDQILAAAEAKGRKKK